MKTLLSFLLVVAGSAIAATPTPSAKELLESVRMRQAQQQLELQGELREDATVIPFRLIQNGPLIRYSFSNPDTALQLRATVMAGDAPVRATRLQNLHV